MGMTELEERVHAEVDNSFNSETGHTFEEIHLIQSARHNNHTQQLKLLCNITVEFMPTICLSHWL